MKRTKGGGGAATRSAMSRYAGVTINSLAVAAAVGEVTLTIRSSRSALSETPLGPSASVGSACATDGTHVRSARLMMTSSRPATNGAYAGTDPGVERSLAYGHADRW